MRKILGKKKIQNDRALLREGKNRSYQRNQEIFDALAKVLKWIIYIVPMVLGVCLLAIMIYYFCTDIDKLVGLLGRILSYIATALATLFIQGWVRKKSNNGL